MNPCRIRTSRIVLVFSAVLALPPVLSGATPATPSTDVPGRIAYEVDGDLWVMDADGTHRVRLTDTPESDFDPSLSPDGQQIVFRTERGTYAPDRQGIGTEGIFIINADGSGEHQLWPPDAQTPGGLFPDWSPTGERIAFSGVTGDGKETLYTIRPDGTGPTDLGMMGEGTEWAPDGTKLAFESHGGDGDWQIWSINADGTGKIPLTTAPAFTPGGPGGNHMGAWSPDGTQIAFASDRGGDFDVYVMTADGSDQRLILDGAVNQAPIVWLPDGRIVITDASAGRLLPDWYVIDADGSNMTPLPQLDGANAPLDWLQFT
jgi:Tol biopolymer transport system component